MSLFMTAAIAEGECPSLSDQTESETGNMPCRAKIELGIMFRLGYEGRRYRRRQILT
jgi:hypothetical protein